MAVAFYAGSFDPLTKGHIFVLHSAFVFCEKIIIAIGENAEKKPFFSKEERLAILEEAIETDLFAYKDKLKILSFEGLLVEAAQKYKADFLLRGIRNEADCIYEMQMADINTLLVQKMKSASKADLKTVFIPAHPNMRSFSSSSIRQIASMGGDISDFVPCATLKAFEKKFPRNRE